MTSKQAKLALDSFSARGSKCPICKRGFRTGCQHSVGEAKRYLSEQYIKTLVQEAVKGEKP